jgi:hypothetical protein
MANGPSYLLIPLVAAFLVFLIRFYVRESATSKSSPSFILACVCVVLLLSAIVLTVLFLLPPYVAYGYAAAGLILLIVGLLGFWR